MAFQNGQESIKIVLDAAESLGMLKEVFVPIEEDEREKIKGLLKEAGNQDMLNKILQVETRMAVSKGFDSIYVVPPTASAAIVTAATAIIMGINSTATIPVAKSSTATAVLSAAVTQPAKTPFVAADVDSVFPKRRVVSLSSCGKSVSLLSFLSCFLPPSKFSLYHHLQRYALIVSTLEFYHLYSLIKDPLHLL